MAVITYYATRNIHADHTQSELVTNGDFTVSTGWTVAAGWSHDAGNGEMDHAAGSIGSLYRSYTPTASQEYIITFTLKNYSAGGVYMFCGNGNGTLRSADGTYTEYVTPTSGTTIGFAATAAAVLSVDDASITITDRWDIEFTPRMLNDTREGINQSLTAIDGSTVTTRMRTDEKFVVESGLLTYAQLTSQYWKEFAASVESGESFTFDARGTVASPDDPRSVILDPGSSVQFTHLHPVDKWRVSFTCRVIP